MLYFNFIFILIFTFNLLFARTDEQAPIPLIFDELVEIYWNLRPNEDALFNCQMGRGRTTTGMIIATLIQLIAHKGLLSMSKPPMSSAATTEADSVAAAFKNGNYSLIVKLIRLLEYGKLAKTLTDICIDYCDHMQNLRTAIYEFKAALESSRFGDKESAQFKEHLARGLNYLIRYFYLS